MKTDLRFSVNEQQDCLVLPRSVEVTSTALRISAELSYGEWELLGARLQRVHKSILFWIGDWLVWGEDHLGQEFSQAIEATGYRNQTLLNAQWVAAAVDNSRRREELAWSHHLEVAALAPEQQDRFLRAAVEGQWSTRELREAVKAARTAGAHDLEPARAKKIDRALDVQSIAKKAIRFLKSELEGANPQDVARTIDSIVHAFAEDLAEDWDEAEILRTKSSKELIAISRVKSAFHGGRVEG